jgi:putative cofactor-binding repeat protein
MIGIVTMKEGANMKVRRSCCRTGLRTVLLLFIFTILSTNCTLEPDDSGGLAGFSISGLEGGVVVSYPMPVSIKAVDSNDQVVMDFAGIVNITVSDPVVTPILDLGTFTNGTADGTLTLIASPQNLPLTISLSIVSGSVSWQSAPVSIENERLDSFQVAAPPLAECFTPFSVQIEALHQAGGAYVGYSDTVELSSSNQSIPVFPDTSTNFVNGRVVVEVSLGGEGITRVQVAEGAATGRSAPISVGPWLRGVRTVDSEGNVGRYGTSIAVDGTVICIAYYGNGTLKFAKSTDCGTTFPAAQIRTVDSTADVGRYASLSVDGNTICITYEDATNRDLKFAKSMDGGTTWPVSDIRTIDSTGSVGQNSSVAVEGSTVYVSYADNSANNLKFAKSTDLGASWPATSMRSVDIAGDVGTQTSIAVNGSDVYISYFEGGFVRAVKFAKSTDGGFSWSPENIHTVDSEGIIGDPVLSIDGNTIYLAYSSGGFLKFTKSTDGGNTWPVENIRTVGSSADVGYKSMAVQGNKVYISYQDSSSYDLEFIWSTDGGDTWSVANLRTVDSIGTVGEHNSISVDGSTICISYYDNTNDDLKLAKSNDWGHNW